MLERDIEQPFVKWCKQVGIKVKKKNFADQLDRWLMIPGGAPIIIEFKVPGKKPTPLQQREIDELQMLEYNCVCLHDLDEAKMYVNRVLKIICNKMISQERHIAVARLRGIIGKIDAVGV